MQKGTLRKETAHDCLTLTLHFSGTKPPRQDPEKQPHVMIFPPSNSTAATMQWRGLSFHDIQQTKFHPLDRQRVKLHHSRWTLHRSSLCLACQMK